MALYLWHEEVTFMKDTEAAIRYYQLHIKNSHWRAWKRLFDLIVTEQKKEADAREQQEFIRQMNAQVEAELEAERQRIEAEKLAAEERRTTESARHDHR